MSDFVFIMTYSTEIHDHGKPHTWYSLPRDKVNWSEPPWGFSGYSKMSASSEDEAKAEFAQEEERWYSQFE